MEFTVDPKANLLTKAHTEKRLEAKVISLLILLAKNSGEVVTRQQIMKEIWPDVIVGSEVIAQLIYSLRNALGDDAKRPKYIETIPKKGYRFMVTVTIVDLNTKKSHKVMMLNGIFITLVLALIFTLANQFWPEKKSIFEINSILPLTQEMGIESDFSFHADHNKMVYRHYDEKNTDLYLRTLGESQSIQLTNDSWIESSPLWLDKDTLIYIRNKANVFQIMRKHRQQSSKVLYQSSSAIIDLALKKNNVTAITFIEYDYYRNDRLNELKSLNLLNGKVEYLHEQFPNLPSHIRNPLYSSDSNTLFFIDVNEGTERIVALNLTNKSYNIMTETFTTIEHISLIDDEHLLISGALFSTKGVWQLNIEQRTIKLLLPSANGQKIIQAKLNSAENSLYYATYKTQTDLVIANIEQQTLALLPKLNSDAEELFGIYSVNDKSIYFVSNRTGFFELWAYNISNKTLRQITALKASEINRPIISPSGQYFAVVYKADVLTLAIIAVQTGQIITETEIPYVKYPLSWSHDEQSIYISEHRVQVNIYQYDSQTLTETLIQNHAGLFATQSSDAQHFMLADYQYNGIINKNITSGEIIPLNNTIEGLTYLIPGELKVIGQSIFTVKTDHEKSQVYRYPLTNNTLKPQSTWLMDLPKNSIVSDFNNNGNQVIFSLTSAPQGGIMQVNEYR